MWTYQGEHIPKLPEGVIGFVYCITNCLTNRKYIGKKLATFSGRSGRSTRTLHGRIKNMGNGRVESDWRTYFGSCKELTADVELFGEEEFIREILYFCKTKSELSYLEAKEQFDRNVLLSDEYYNKLINVRVNANNLRH